MNMREALGIFGVSVEKMAQENIWHDVGEMEEWVKKACRKRFRMLAKKLHPDVKGSHDKMVELNQALELVEQIKIQLQPPQTVIRWRVIRAGSYTDATSTSMNATSGYY